MSTLYIVATPIGNLEDISMRALRILGEVDFILCEDTRITKKLLDHYSIKTPTISYHQHSGEQKVEYILRLLDENKNLALVSDAGTPGISDPGGKLVQAVIDKFNIGGLQATSIKREHTTPVQIEVIPGPSAVTAALSISGIPTDKFVFMGFPPHKKGRQKFIKKIITSEFPVVIYESKHRILKLLDELDGVNKRIIAENRKIELEEKKGRTKEEKKKLTPMTSVVVCREISKMHETVYRGEIKSITQKIKENKDEQKGEFVVIIGK